MHAGGGPACLAGMPLSADMWGQCAVTFPLLTLYITYLSKPSSNELTDECEYLYPRRLNCVLMMSFLYTSHYFKPLSLSEVRGYMTIDL
jgi:hypothetical protein